MARRLRIAAAHPSRPGRRGRVRRAGWRLCVVQRVLDGGTSRVRSDRAAARGPVRRVHRRARSGVAGRRGRPARNSEHPQPRLAVAQAWGVLVGGGDARIEHAWDTPQAPLAIRARSRCTAVPGAISGWSEGTSVTLGSIPCSSASRSGAAQRGPSYAGRPLTVVPVLQGQRSERAVHRRGPVRDRLGRRGGERLAPARPALRPARLRGASARSRCGAARERSTSRASSPPGRSR